VHSPPLKAETALFDMDHPVSGINSLAHFVNRVLITLLHTLSIAHTPVSPCTCTIHHSFSLSFQDQNLFFTQISFTPYTSYIVRTAFTDFLATYVYLLSWYPVRFWVHIKIAHIVSYALYTTTAYLGLTYMKLTKI